MSEQSVVDFWRDAILSSGAYPEFALLRPKETCGHDATRCVTTPLEGECKGMRS